MDMKCAAAPDTLTERPTTTTGASVQVRYSRVCGTSWARMWGARIGDRIEMRAGGPGTPIRGARIGDQADADAYVYTPMSVTRPGPMVQACFLPEAGGEKECFEARAGPSGP
ncbi:DUF2690 domain-containing protein [Streptomyces sp. NBC_01190]|uniref:DUF2690 domain-containing protein n=1 Tax=Streptomyces sp. NBC_01190 TaxID=2903767 RepID=UPI003869BEB7|nr:YjfA family protein [Streptomyces sp. NBC_01190]